MCFYTTFKDQRKKNRERLRRGRAIKYTLGETNMLIALLKTFAYYQFFSDIAQEITDENLRFIQQLIFIKLSLHI